ncbi:MAG: cation:proton antiporter [Cytophagales bacterium]|nr:cation:proton antiporter [Rhizobacter sp.]
MTELHNWLAPTAGSTAPLWTLDGLRGADPVLGFALVMLVAVVLGELLHRRLRLPRMVGHMITGALASPLALRLLERTDLDPWKPLIDLAIGVLVFELGSRVRPRWLIDNPWLALTCLLEGLLAGLCVTVALVSLGAPVASAWLAGAVAMSTSPVITLVLVHEQRSRGQVTERLLITTAINSALSILALKAWRVVTAADAASLSAELLPVATDAIIVVIGSFLLGVATGWVLAKLTQPLRGAAAAPVLQIALVILAAMLAAQWQLSALLALLVAGMVARSRIGHALTVEPHLGSAGAVLTVLLFIALGMLFTLDGITTLWPWVLAILLARLVGKGFAVGMLARFSALGWRQSAALTLALQPMSSLAVLLAANTFGWTSQLPGVAGGVLQALLIATTMLHLLGPVLTQWSLRSLAQECPPPSNRGV